eukprot:COSAG01_NODE_53413_length_339_cov_1.037500_1_plen_85_part_10
MYVRHLEKCNQLFCFKLIVGGCHCVTQEMQRQQLSRHQLEFDAKISALITRQTELGPTSEQLDNESSHNEQSPFGKISTRLMNTS